MKNKYDNGNVSMSPSIIMYLGVRSSPVQNVLYVAHKDGWDKDLFFRVTRVTTSILKTRDFKVAQLHNGDIFVSCKSFADAEKLDNKRKKNLLWGDWISH